MTKVTGTGEPMSEDNNPYLEVEQACIACGWCKYNCPVDNCITFDTPIARINSETCIECDRCIFVCPINVIIPLREARPRKLQKLHYDE